MSRVHHCDFCGVEVKYNYLPGEFFVSRDHKPITVDVRRFSRDVCVSCLISLLAQLLPAQPKEARDA